MKQLGFKGCLLNPDPYENSGTEAPALGDRYWYPLYEKLCELDVPAHIHATGSQSERTPYTLHFINEETIAVFGLVNSDVFKDFPTLKIVVSHGGGAIPYQLGRFDRAVAARQGRALPRRHAQALLRHRALHRGRAAAADQDGRPGPLPVRRRMPRRRLGGQSGHRPAPSTTSRRYIEGFDWLTAAAEEDDLRDNARKVFKLVP